ncbi:hypothetical protein ABBQ32_005829 [Trebouxia sp. C0010 RCD-2024]
MKQRRVCPQTFSASRPGVTSLFSRGVDLKYKNGAVIQKCDRGEANKVVAAAAQAARATAPAVTRRQPARRASVAMDPTQVLHRSGVSVLGHLSDPLVSEAQASMAATGESSSSGQGVDQEVKPGYSFVYHTWHLRKMMQPHNLICEGCF